MQVQNKFGQFNTSCKLIQCIRIRMIGNLPTSQASLFLPSSLPALTLPLRIHILHQRQTRPRDQLGLLVVSFHFVVRATLYYIYLGLQCVYIAKKSRILAASAPIVWWASHVS